LYQSKRALEKPFFTFEPLRVRFYPAESQKRPYRALWGHEIGLEVPNDPLWADVIPMSNKTPTGRGNHRFRAAAVVRHLRRRMKMTRAELSHRMGVSPKTLDHTLKILNHGDVFKRGTKDNSLSLNPNIGYLIGVEVNQHRARVAVTDLDFELVPSIDSSSLVVDIPINDPKESIHLIAGLINEALGNNWGEDEVSRNLVGVGITLPGPILREPNPDEKQKGGAEYNRRVEAGPILPKWDDIDVGAELATRLMRGYGIQPPRFEDRRFVWLENDASAGALGVYTMLRKTRASGEAPEDLVYIRVASGIGAGIINKSHLVSGFRGFAGEIGHLTIDPGGTLCPTCGGRGCLETKSSNRAVMEQLRDVLQLGPEDRFGEDVLGNSHPAVARAVSDAGWHLGTAAAHVCTLLNPELIVLGGAMPRFKATDHEGNGYQPLVRSMESALRLNSPDQVWGVPT
jgi:predicted NBD/HSP70 family sugar kinase